MVTIDGSAEEEPTATVLFNPGLAQSVPAETMNTVPAD
jgi:hypothetical protein